MNEIKGNDTIRVYNYWCQINGLKANKVESILLYKVFKAVKEVQDAVLPG